MIPANAKSHRSLVGWDGADASPEFDNCSKGTGTLTGGVSPQLRPYYAA